MVEVVGSTNSLLDNYNSANRSIHVSFSTYLTNFKTVDEIGAHFRRNGVRYLGEIVLDKYDQIFGEYEREHLADYVSDLGENANKHEAHSRWIASR